MSLANTTQRAPKLTPGGAVKMGPGFDNIAGVPYDHPNYNQLRSNNHPTFPNPRARQADRPILTDTRRIQLVIGFYAFDGSRGYGRKWGFFCKVGANIEQDADLVPSGPWPAVPMQWWTLENRGNPHYFQPTLQDSALGVSQEDRNTFPTGAVCWDPNLTPADAATMMKSFINPIRYSDDNPEGDIGNYPIFDAVMRATGYEGWFFPPNYNMFSFLIPSHPDVLNNYATAIYINYYPQIADVEPHLWYTGYAKSTPIAPVRTGYLDEIYFAYERLHWNGNPARNSFVWEDFGFNPNGTVVWP